MTPGEFWAGIATAAIGSGITVGITVTVWVIRFSVKWGDMVARMTDAEGRLTAHSKDIRDNSRRITQLESRGTHTH